MANVDLEQEYDDWAETFQGTIGIMGCAIPWESWVEQRVAEGIDRTVFDEVDEERRDEVLEEVAPLCPCCGWHSYDDLCYENADYPDDDVCSDCESLNDED